MSSVAIGDNIQASILTTLLLKEMEISQVWVKAKNDYHHKVLDKIGADQVVHPENDMGRRIAQQMSDEKVIDFIELSSDIQYCRADCHKETGRQNINSIRYPGKIRGNNTCY
jgi:Trk K+ transport system NAD-binding subunit